VSIQLRAEDFFNAYLVLKENNEVFIVRQANSSEYLRNETNAIGMHPAIGVEIVCLAFAVELHVKDLHFAVNGKAPHGHNILELFEKLTEQIQQEIFTHDSISQNPCFTRGDLFSAKRHASSDSAYDGFIYQIKAISDGFEKWRYSYERRSLRYDVSFALAFIEAIKSATGTVRKQSTVKR